MIFKTKRDKKISVMFAIIVIVTVCIGASALITSQTIVDWIIFLVFLILAVLLAWIVIDIKYIFHENELVVKGGPIRSHIPFNKMTKVSEPTDNLTGYRLLGSSDSIEMFYKSHKGKEKSVKISPERGDLFFEELKSRNPEIEFEIL